MADQTNPNMMALKDLLAFKPNVSAVPTVAPMAQVAPQLSPTAQYINDMQTLLRGGIGKLSTGEKLGAVGQILQAAGSRGAADPGAVIQNVRQQQMQKLNAQYQIAQLQKQQQQEQQQIAAIQKYSELLTDDERAALEGLPLDKRAEKISEIAFRPKQVQQIVRSSDGKTRIVYQNGDTQIADWALPPKTKYENLGDRLVLVDEDTGKPVIGEDGKPQELKVNMSPAQAANYGLDLARFRRGDGRSDSSASSLPQPTVKMMNGKPVYVQWDKRSQKYVPFNQAGLQAPTKGDALTAQLAPAVLQLLAQGGNIK